METPFHWDYLHLLFLQLMEFLESIKKEFFRKVLGNY
jgi:hypothetical protein